MQTYQKLPLLCLFAGHGIKSVIRILPIMFSLVFGSGCNNGYTHQLPNGYSLIHIYSGSLAVADPKSRIIVGPSKCGIVIGVKNSYIVGNLETEEKAFDIEEIPDKYFIVDTDSGTILANLSLSEYEDRIKRLKLGEVPLKRPNKLDYK